MHAWYCHITSLLFIQVIEKSCRLRMGAYRDGVKRKETRLGWEYNSHIVCMCIIMRRSEISLPTNSGPPHYYAHTNYVTIILPSQPCLLSFYTIPICTHSQSARFFNYLSLFIFKALGYCLCLTVVGKYMYVCANL